MKTSMILGMFAALVLVSAVSAEQATTPVSQEGGQDLECGQVGMAHWRDPPRELQAGGGVATDAHRGGDRRSGGRDLRSRLALGPQIGRASWRGKG